jgi:hypothetical protein
VRRAEQDRARLDGDRPAIRQNRHGDCGHDAILDQVIAGARKGTMRKPSPARLGCG